MYTRRVSKITSKRNVTVADEWLHFIFILPLRWWDYCVSSVTIKIIIDTRKGSQSRAR